MRVDLYSLRFDFFLLRRQGRGFWVPEMSVREERFMSTKVKFQTVLFKVIV